MKNEFDIYLTFQKKQLLQFQKQDQLQESDLSGVQTPKQAKSSAMLKHNHQLLRSLSISC